ncbi:tail terminator [Microbacterium phage GardenState]|uniref:Tail terminator n=2 Tax=Gardenstatevirus TaxID=3425012 RepID=A0A4Y6E6Z8_9CAUD|nr:tail terminator [Microbacterium phage IAmGroot]QOI66923.1 tail terminator [Microbacterium phage GardenState]
MTTDPILFPDPQRATRDALRATLPAYGIDADVTMSRPSHTPGVPLARPHIRVRTGTPTRDTPASASALVRLTVFDRDEGAAMALAAKVEAILLAEASSSDVRSFGPVSGPVPGTDQDTGEPIALVTVQARLRPRHLRKE